LTRSAQSTATVANHASAMENIVIGLISLGLLLYLVVAVLRPEKF
jgi:K+-transporting ATPase KdpF subunit